MVEGIHDPSMTDERFLNEPAVSLSKFSASVRYPDGTVLWFNIKDGKPAFDAKKTGTGGGDSVFQRLPDAVKRITENLKQ